MSNLFEVSGLSIEAKVSILQGDLVPGNTPETDAAPRGSVYFCTSGITYKKVADGTGPLVWAIDSGDVTSGILSVDNVAANTVQVLDSVSKDFAETVIWSVTVSSINEPADKEVVVLTGSHNEVIAKYSMYSKLFFGQKIPNLTYNVQLLAGNLQLVVSAGVATNIECYRLTAVSKGTIVFQGTVGGGSGGDVTLAQLQAETDQRLSQDADLRVSIAGLRTDVNAHTTLINNINLTNGKSAYEIALQHDYNIGTEIAWLASLEGPKGDTGLTGAKGDQGFPGASAYQVALANGFVGTEAEWLASLQGTGTGGGTPAPLGGTSPYITTYLHTFDNTSIINDKLLIPHNLGQKYVTVQVYDDSDLQVIPYNVKLTSNTILELDLTTFTPIAGTWHVMVVAGSSDKGANGSVLSKAIIPASNNLIDMPLNGNFTNYGETRELPFKVAFPQANWSGLFTPKDTYESDLSTNYHLNSSYFFTHDGFVKVHPSNPAGQPLVRSRYELRVATVLQDENDPNSAVPAWEALELVDTNAPLYVFKNNFGYATEVFSRGQELIEFSDLDTRVYYPAGPWFEPNARGGLVLIQKDFDTNKKYVVATVQPDGSGEFTASRLEILEVLPAKFSYHNSILGTHTPLIKHTPVTNFGSVLPDDFSLTFNLNLEETPTTEQAIVGLYDSRTLSADNTTLNGFVVYVLPDKRLQLYIGNGTTHKFIDMTAALTIELYDYKFVWSAVTIQRKKASPTFNNMEVWSISVNDTVIGYYGGETLPNPVFGLENYISIGSLMYPAAFDTIPVYTCISPSNLLLSDLKLEKGIVRTGQLEEAYLQATSNVGESGSSFIFN